MFTLNLTTFFPPLLMILLVLPQELGTRGPVHPTGPVKARGGHCDPPHSVCHTTRP